MGDVRRLRSVSQYGSRWKATHERANPKAWEISRIRDAIAQLRIAEELPHTTDEPVNMLPDGERVYWLRCVPQSALAIVYGFTDETLLLVALKRNS